MHVHLFYSFIIGNVNYNLGRWERINTCVYSVVTYLDPTSVHSLRTRTVLSVSQAYLRLAWRIQAYYIRGTIFPV